MSTPKDILPFYLPKNKPYLFLIFFGIPFLAIWLFWGCGFSFIIAISNRSVEGNLHPLITDPMLAVWLIGFELGVLAGFSAWFLVIFRRHKLISWAYVSLCSLVLVAFIVLSGNDWSEGFFRLVRYLLFFGGIFGLSFLLGYYLKKRPKISCSLEPTVSAFLHEGEQVLMKCAANQRRRGQRTSGWLYVTQTRVLFLESAPQDQIAVDHSIPLESVLQAKPGLTLTFMPEELLIELPDGTQEFEVEECWNLVVLINERKQ